MLGHAKALGEDLSHGGVKGEGEGAGLGPGSWVRVGGPASDEGSLGCPASQAPETRTSVLKVLTSRSSKCRPMSSSSSAEQSSGGVPSGFGDAPATAVAAAAPEGHSPPLCKASECLPHQHRHS